LSHHSLELMKFFSLVALTFLALLALSNGADEQTTPMPVSTPPTTPSTPPVCSPQVQTICAAKEIECRSQCSLSPFVWECSSVDNVVTSCAVGNGCSCSGCSVLSPTTPQSIHVSEGTFTGRVSLAIVFVAGIFVLI